MRYTIEPFSDPELAWSTDVSSFKCLSIDEQLELTNLLYTEIARSNYLDKINYLLSISKTILE